MSKGGQCFQYFGDAGAAGRLKPGGDLLDILHGGSPKRIFNGADLIGKGGRPGLFAAGGGWSFDGSHARQRGLDKQFVGRLELGTQPADEACAFFGAALGIECNHTGEDVFVAECSGPAIGGEDGCVEFVVEFAQHPDETGVVDAAVFGRQFFRGAKFFEDVVHLGQGQIGGEFLLAFAVRVQAFSDATNRLFLRVGAIGKWEGSKQRVLT